MFKFLRRNRQSVCSIRFAQLKKAVIQITNPIPSLSVVKIGSGVRLPGDAKISAVTQIGDHSRFNRGVKIKGTGNVHFSNFCAVGEELTVISSNHNAELMNLQLNLFKQAGMDSHDIVKTVSIGHNVWIGDRVTLLPGARIGSGSVIGAGSIVNKTIPPFVVAAGNPVRILRKRCSDEVASVLMEFSWWNWPIEKILTNKHLLEVNISKIDAKDLRRRIEASLQKRDTP